MVVKCIAGKKTKRGDWSEREFSVFRGTHSVIWLSSFTVSLCNGCTTQILKVEGENDGDAGLPGKPLMLAISKMTYQYTNFLQDNGILQMANKGRINVGADADITIFNPDTVKQVATPANGGSPGQPIRFPVHKLFKPGRL